MPFRKIFKVIVLSLALIGFGLELKDFMAGSVEQLQRFDLIHWDSASLDGLSPLTRIALEAKTLVPPGSSIELSVNSKNATWPIVAFKYIMYPSEVHSNGQYYLDLNGSNQDPPSSWKSVSLSYGSKIYAKDGMHFEKHEPYHKEGLIFFICKFSLFLLATLVIVLVGETILSGILSTTTLLPLKPGLFWYYSTVYLAGYITLGSLFWVYLLCGGTVNTALIFLSFILILILCFLFKVLSGKKFDSSVLKEGTGTDVPLWIKIFVVTFFVIYILRILSCPINFWDELELWVLKAKVLFYHGQLDLTYINRDNYYPLLWPLNMALYFYCVNGDFDWVAKCASALAFIAFIGQLWGGLRVLQLRRGLLWSLSFCYFLFLKNQMFLTALPENMYMALVTAFGVSVTIWIKTEKKAMFYLSMIFLSGLCLTKTEGGVVAVIFILFLSAFLRDRCDVLKCICLLPPFIIPLAWAQWLNAHGYDASAGHLGGFNFTNINIIGAIFIDYVVHDRIVWLVLLGLSSLVLINRAQPWDLGQKFLFFMGSGLMIFSLISGLFWKHELLIYYPEVFLRLFLRCAPFIFMLWVSRVGFERFSLKTFKGSA